MSEEIPFEYKMNIGGKDIRCRLVAGFVPISDDEERYENKGIIGIRATVCTYVPPENRKIVEEQLAKDYSLIEKPSFSELGN
jgi:hypothetical protein